MKTAVEWLENEMQKTYIFNQDDFDMFKKAKEMEKQQIIDARVKKPLDTEWLEAEQYYKETFKKENNENKN
jgi:hypothetical protein